MTSEINPSTKTAIETAITIALIGLIAVVTLRIIQPFIMPVAWGVLIAIAGNPFITMVTKRLGNRRNLIATLFALVVITALVVPSVMLVSASIDTVQQLSEHLGGATLSVPPPPLTIEEWPVVGKSLFSSWSLTSSNLEETLKQPSS